MPVAYFYGVNALFVFVYSCCIYYIPSYFTCTLKFLTHACMHRREAPVRCTSNIKTLSVDPSMSTQTDSVTTEGVNSLLKLIVSVILQLFTQLFSLV